MSMCTLWQATLAAAVYLLLFPSYQLRYIFCIVTADTQKVKDYQNVAE